MKKRKKFDLSIILAEDQKSDRSGTQFITENSGVPDEFVLTMIRAYLKILEENYIRGFMESSAIWKED